MNLNQQKEQEYREQCRKYFYGIVHLVDKLFAGNIELSEPNILPTWLRLDDVKTWRVQINTALLKWYIEKHCQPCYYSKLTHSIREYKLKKRIKNESN